MAAKILPAALLKAIAAGLADVYWLFQRRRCEVVVQNFLPIFSGDKIAAEKAARAAHRNFAAKLIDLWRVENGDVTRNWLTTDGELEIIHAARQRGRGTLFITLHLGNWEHGGLLLNQLGIRLTILTQAEPDDGLTDLRKAARALRRGHTDHRRRRLCVRRGHQTVAGRRGHGCVAGPSAGARRRAGGIFWKTI